MNELIRIKIEIICSNHSLQLHTGSSSFECWAAPVAESELISFSFLIYSRIHIIVLPVTGLFQCSGDKKARWREKEGRMSGRHVRKQSSKPAKPRLMVLYEQIQFPSILSLSAAAYMSPIWISFSETLFLSWGVNVPADGFCGCSQK